jgi:hypothetical protein
LRRDGVHQLLASGGPTAARRFSSTPLAATKAVTFVAP